MAMTITAMPVRWAKRFVKLAISILLKINSITLFLAVMDLLFTGRSERFWSRRRSYYLKSTVLAKFLDRDLESIERIVKKTTEKRRGILVTVLANYLFLCGQSEKAIFLWKAFPKAWNSDAEYLVFGLSCHFFDANADDDLIIDLHRRSCARLIKPASSKMASAAARMASQKIRLGYVCSYYQRAQYAFIFENILRSHSHDKFQVFLIAEERLTPLERRRLSDSHVELVELADVPDHEILKCIRAYDFDVLIDCDGPFANRGMTKANLIFYDECARIKISWANILISLGHPAFDYILSYDSLHPVGVEEQWPEKIIRLPSRTSICLFPDDYLRSGLPLAQEGSGRITFGAALEMHKVNARTMSLWGSVLDAVPNSRLLLVHPCYGHASLRAYIRNHFKQRQVEPDRLEFSSVGGYPAYLSQYANMDVGLGAYPITGGTTLLHALSRGFFYVNLVREDYTYSRLALSLYAGLGVEELCPFKEADYIDMCVKLAGDPSLSLQYRNKILSTLHRIKSEDSRSFTVCLEEEITTLMRGR